MNAPRTSTTPAEATERLQEALAKALHGKVFGPKWWARHSEGFKAFYYADAAVLIDGPLAATLAEHAAERARGDEAERDAAAAHANADENYRRLTAAEADRGRLAERVAVLEAALKPFGDVCDAGHMKHVRDEQVLELSTRAEVPVSEKLRGSHFRAARRALTITDGGSDGTV